MDYKAEYRRWLEEFRDDPETVQELLSLEGNEKEIEDRFYTELEFGTAGMRGVLGAGLNRMNQYNVRRATLGLARYIAEDPERQARGVVIAYDSRRKSDEFARQAALVLCAAGIPAYLFESLRPVPVLSFSVRALHAVAGIVFSIVGAIMFLLFPDVLNALSHRGDGVPFDPFNTEAIRSSAWVIIAWTVVCIGAESFKLVEGRYTPRLLAVTLVSNLVVAALAVFWLTNFQLVDSQAILQAMQASGDAPSGPHI